MKFIAFYIKNGQVEKEVIDSCALTLAQMKAMITARRTGRELSKVIYDDLYLNLEKGFKHKDIKSIYDNIMLYSNDDKLLGENIEEILKENDIEYTVEDGNIFSVDIAIKEDYARLNFHYNEHGILLLNDIELFKGKEDFALVKGF